MPNVVLDNRKILTVSGETTGGGNLTGDRTIGLANIAAITPNTYGNTTTYPSIQVDKKGRVVNVVSLSFSNAYMANTILESPRIIGRITKNGHWVTPYILAGADHDCSGIGGVDQTAKFANALIETNATGRELYLEPGYYDVYANAFINITTSGVSIKGAGRNSSYIRNLASSGNTLTFQNQFPHVSDVTFWPLAYRSSGSEIALNGTYQGMIENTLFQYHRQAVDVFNCATPEVKSSLALYCYGFENFKMHGNASIGTYGAIINDVIFNNAPTLPQGLYSAWGFNKLFNVGELTYVDGWILQCTQTGTTASSGAIVVAFPNSYSWTQTDITHGGAKFRPQQTTPLTHILQDNYGYSLQIKNAICLNGAYAYRMTDTANTGTSAPMWMDGIQMVSDHAFFGGIYASHGSDINLGVGTWLGSTLHGSGVAAVDQFKGPFKMLQARVMGNAHNGMYHLAGKKFHLAYNVFAANGYESIGNFNDIYIAPNINDFDYSHNSFGPENGLGTNYTNYGILLDAGTSDGYVMAFNRGNGLISSVVYDGGTGLNKYVDQNLNW